MLDESLELGHQSQEPLQLLNNRLIIRKLIGEGHQAHVHRRHAVLVQHLLMLVVKYLLDIHLQLVQLL